MIAVYIESATESISTTAAGLLPPVNSPFEQSFDDSNGAQPMPRRLQAATSAPRPVDRAFELLESRYGDLLRQQTSVGR